MEKEVGQEMNRGANPLVIASAQSAIAEPFSYLKQVSRVKHEILGRYLGAWSGKAMDGMWMNGDSSFRARRSTRCGWLPTSCRSLRDGR
jgi:hypothetical protein